jgi:putative ABC transport system substrate-binding protein
MSAFEGKADIEPLLRGGLLLTRNGHQSPSLFLPSALKTIALAAVIRPRRFDQDGVEAASFNIGGNAETERVPALAAELVRLGVDVIAVGNTANTVAAMKATTTIPIVMGNSIDPVGAGLVATLARPGGNVTGLTQDTGDELNGKRLELLKEILPNISRVGILWNPDFEANPNRLTSMREVTQLLGLTLVSAEARGSDALEQAFATMVAERAQAFVMFADPMLFNYRGQVGVMALRDRLPAISGPREYAEAGLLLTYGANLQELFRRVAVFIDKIFKGAKPADLPVEQPTKFELVVNLKTAKALGLEVPTSLLLRADQVIE